MEMKRQHVGLVGCGQWGKKILQCLVSLGCEVSVIARSSESQENARQGGAAKVLSEIQELKNISGIVIATATETHFELIKELLLHGVPLFVEKPVTASLEQTEMLHRTANGKVFVMDKYRYHPAIRALADLVSDGKYGELISLKTRRSGWAVPKGPVDFIWDLAPHEMAIVLTICGGIPELKHKVIERIGNNSVGCTAFFGETPAIVCELNKGSSLKSREVRVNFADALAVWNASEEDKIRIVNIDDLQNKSHESTTVLSVAKQDPLKLELEAFLAFLDGGPEPMSNLTDAVLIAERISLLMNLAMEPNYG